MHNLEAYNQFLRNKIKIAPKEGFGLDVNLINPNLKPHNKIMVKWLVEGGRRACFASFGLHKCHGKGTPILMFDGSIKKVEDISIGDKLMGDESHPRTVLSLANGTEQLYRIRLKNGDSYVCNRSHILSLKVSNKYRQYKKGDIVNMRLVDFMELPDYAKRNCFKHYKVPVSFEKQDVPMSPYLYGAWLGDGIKKTLGWCINDVDYQIAEEIKRFATDKDLSIREEKGRGCTNYFLVRKIKGKAKHIDEFYFLKNNHEHDNLRIDKRFLINDRTTRLELLAGLIDTDGNLRDKCLRINTKYAGLRDDILFLARSLGLSVSHNIQIIDDVTYYTITISGNTDMVPCKTRKKAGERLQIKTPLVYGFDIESIGIGEYFGFEIDGNHLYLLGDFTVTHNTVTQLEAVRLTLDKVGGGKGLIVCPLNIKQEFVEDSKNILHWETKPKFIRRNSELTGDGIYLTNYESIRDGKLDPNNFKVASLDEASILRGLGGTKTFREFMRLFTGDAGPMGSRRGEDHVKYRFVATATPSPNDYIELLAYADFLGIMDVSQAKTRFFKRDSTKADKLTLHAHKEDEFWLWVSSWAIFVNKPSDITGNPEDDNGYILPELDLRWHEIPSDHSKAGTEKNGQIKMFSDASSGGLSGAAKEKRESMPARIEKMLELRQDDPTAHRIIWHDLESERHAIESAISDVVSIYGSQDYEKREQAILDFTYGRFQELAAKPVIAGSGCNFQRHCHWAIYLGIGFKFNDFIQSIHRIQRFLQDHKVRIDLIYTEAERGVRKSLETKWKNHTKLINKMTEIIRKYGLSHSEMAQVLTRKIGVERVVVEGEKFKLFCNDNVVELSKYNDIKDNSVGLIGTSIPFSTQFEYSPNYSDFGHSESNEEFFRQMDFLTPLLMQKLMPGRLAVIHVKDRIVPMGLSGMGVQESYPFHKDVIENFTTCPECRIRIAQEKYEGKKVIPCKHSFAYLGMKTIVTDVVRENNQTYRLGWSEQCKDGSKMGVGMPEYLLYFRKPQTDRSNAYADIPVFKEKKDWKKKEQRWENPNGYSRAKWQMDAHGFTRSSGNRGITPDELASMAPDKIFKWFRDYSLNEIWDFDYIVKIAETLEMHGKLPSGFMLLQPQSWSDEVWTDVTRMRTLNGSQWSKGKEMHLCPMQFDIADRMIQQLSNPGEIILDPFNGIGTVTYRAILLGRIGYGIELNHQYFLDGAAYCRGAEQKINMPTLFDTLELEGKTA